jgi:ABC-type antimicrobial peptide transport system permease subunit
MQDFYHQRAVKTPDIIVQAVGSLGMMGLILAVAGLYGLVAYSVSRRTREIGIRMAIGADRGTVVRMVLSEGMRLGLAGVAVGLIFGYFAYRVVTSAFGSGDRQQPFEYRLHPAGQRRRHLPACAVPVPRALPSGSGGGRLQRRWKDGPRGDRGLFTGEYHLHRYGVDSAEHYSIGWRAGFSRL